MSELKGVCDRHPGLSLLVLHHQNKRLDHADPFDSVSGTGAYSAGPDTVLIFERQRNQSEGTLYFRGRDIGESDYGLSFDPVLLMWGITGTADEARMSREQREILGAIAELGKDSTPKEIMDALERVGESARVSTQNQLRKMVNAGILVNNNGKYRRAIAYQGPLNQSITSITPTTGNTPITPITPPGEQRGATSPQAVSGTGVVADIGVAGVTGVIGTHRDVKPASGDSDIQTIGLSDDSDGEEIV
jgi:hypothetical protein